MALWWFANAVLYAVVIPVVVVLGQLVVRRALAVRNGAELIGRGSRALADDSAALTVLDSTRERLDSFRDLTGAYAGAVNEGTLHVRRPGLLRRWTRSLRTTAAPRRRR